MYIDSEIQEPLLYHRYRKTPEWIRKLKYIFNVKKCLDILFFVLLGISILFWCIHIFEILNMVTYFNDI